MAKIQKYIDLKGLEIYHERLITMIDKKIELSKFAFTNCPNCGAIITSSKCEYCGTDFTLITGKFSN